LEVYIGRRVVTGRKLWVGGGDVSGDSWFGMIGCEGS
jgi:hypothetical protein